MKNELRSEADLQIYRKVKINADENLKTCFMRGIPKGQNTRPMQLVFSN